MRAGPGSHRRFGNSAVAGGKRILAVAITAAAATAASLAFAAPGNAAPYVQAPELSLSTSGPCQGTSLTVAGTSFVPGSAVGLTMRPSAASLGAAVASADGTFTRAVTLPKTTGTFQIIAAGPPKPENSNTAEATVHIRDCTGPVPITGYTGGPHSRGSYALPAGLAVLACLALGGGLTWWCRHRRHAA